jgi:hypothetical protein
VDAGLLMSSALSLKPSEQIPTESRERLGRRFAPPNAPAELAEDLNP